MYLVGIYWLSDDAGAQVAIIYSHLDLCGRWMCWDRLCTKGRAFRTKETLPDFRERCRVTRHSRVFPRVDE